MESCATGRIIGVVEVKRDDFLQGIAQASVQMESSLVSIQVCIRIRYFFFWMPYISHVNTVLVYVYRRVANGSLMNWRLNRLLVPFSQL